MRSIPLVIGTVLLALGSSELFLAVEEPPRPETMDEKALLAHARLFTQEELEISRRAVRQAGSEKVRAFAKRAAARSEALDKKLTDLAKAAGVPEPQPGSQPLFVRLAAIEKLRGEAFNPDYLKLVLDFHREHMVIYERLARIATTGALREFAQAALAEERAHLKEAQELAEPLVPHAKPAAE